ncbi:MAG: glutamate--tRNA ligase [Candidatus Gottesmanbacteria bacterium]
MMKVRTRIAPSPTGQDLHIGNAYTALINYVFAKKHNGLFIIRIEDTDRTRLVEGSEERILKSLEWLGIPHTEGPDIGGPFAPYRQSDRLPIYRKYAEELVEKGHAYYCFCTSERLGEMRTKQEANHQPPMYDGLCKKIDKEEVKERIKEGKKYVIRLNVPEKGTTTFHDLIHGDISFENKLLDDQVLLKSDGYPTYHLGVVVDDHIMEISHIIRGEEWISSTPKHVLLYQFFGWTPPEFAHVSVLRNPDKSKLSKRKNPVWVSDYRAKGYLPEAMKNYMATMAWSYDGKELFTIDEMIEKFDIADVQTTAPVFDQEKLRWMNGEYIRKMDDAELISKICAFDATVPKESDAIMKKILPLVRERMKTLGEFETLADFFFVRPVAFERELKKDVLKIAADALTSASSWTHDAMEKAIRDAADKAKVKAKDVFMELRLAITGKTVGPPLLESLEVLGKEEILERLSSL